MDLGLHVFLFLVFCFTAVSAKNCIEGRDVVEKASIEKINNNIYQYTDSEETFYVVVLPEMVALYGDPGKQFFKNEENLGFSDLNEETLKRNAQLHVGGITNKKKFYKSVRQQKQEGRLTDDQHKLLLEFIEDCHCSPKTVSSHLISFGLNPNRFEFSTPYPEYTRTLGSMKKFLEAWYNFKEESLT